MTDAPANTPEFHIIVRRPGRGPLAPYRFVLAILFSLAIAGRDLYAAAETGIGVDHALLYAAASGLFAWLVLGRVNSILQQGAPPSQRVDVDDHSTPPMQSAH